MKKFLILILLIGIVLISVCVTQKSETKCTQDIDCSYNEQCINGTCQILSCDYCQYTENHVCINYGCCSDSDCDDKNASTLDMCIYPKAKQAKCENKPEAKVDPIEKCEEETSESLRDHCYRTIAVHQTLNFSICDKIKNEHSKIGCRIDIAIKKNDIPLCIEVAEDREGRDKCYYEIGVRVRKDVSLCEKVEDQFLRYMCMALITRDESYCYKMVRSSDQYICLQIFS